MNADALKQLLERSPGLTLPQALRKMLETSIVTGTIVGGAHINENALAAAVGVNRAALREALTALAEAGLIEFVRNRGAFVRSVGLDEAVHLYDVRAGLGRAAGRLLALRVTPRELRELEALHEELRRFCEAEDIDQYDATNITFHKRLVECAHNPHLVRIEDNVGREIRLFLREGVVTPTSLRISHKEHGDILEAVRNSDPEQAGLAFETHVLNGKQRMLENVGHYARAAQGLPLTARQATA
jgi:DNA-binding GntR family transcriptional regulator